MQEGITWNRVCIPIHQSAKESLHLSSFLCIRGVLSWIEASIMSLLCCLSGEKEGMARDVLYIEDSPYQQNKSIMLCMIPDPALPWFSHCNQVRQTSIAVGCTGLSGAPGAARASLCWSLCCYCSTASLKLSWLSQPKLEGSISKCKYNLWIISGALSFQQFWLKVSCCSQPHSHRIW